MHLDRKAIFFDRDGTLIEDKHYLNDPQDIVYVPGVFEQLGQLQAVGYHFVIVTNQSGIPRGLVSESDLQRIHAKLRADFRAQGIDFLDFYHAPYMPESNHPLRKPNPGMLKQAAEDHNLNLASSWMVGDKESDIAAGQKAGTKTALIAPQTLSTTPKPDLIAPSLKEVTAQLLKLA